MKTPIPKEFKIIQAFLFILLIPFNTLFSQVISGTVYCNETKESLPYPSIKVKNAENSRMCSSYETGNFEFEINQEELQQDTLFINYIGYDFIQIPLSNLDKNNNVFFLKKKVIDIASVDIVENSKIKLLGKEKTNASIGWSDVKKGDEIGVIFKNNKKLLLDKIYLPVNELSYDTICIKLNIYKISSLIEIKDKPNIPHNKYHNIVSNEVLKESVYLEIDKESIDNGNIVIDLSIFDAIIKDDFFVSIEIVKDLSGGTFRLNANKKGRTYGNLPNKNEWASTGVRMAMKIKVREYPN